MFLEKTYRFIKTSTNGNLQQMNVIINKYQIEGKQKNVTYTSTLEGASRVMNYVFHMLGF
jgi:hypothetical protein